MSALFPRFRKSHPRATCAVFGRRDGGIQGLADQCGWLGLTDSLYPFHNRVERTQLDALINYRRANTTTLPLRTHYPPAQWDLGLVEFEGATFSKGIANHGPHSLNSRMWLQVPPILSSDSVLGPLRSSLSPTSTRADSPLLAQEGGWAGKQQSETMILDNDAYRSQRWAAGAIRLKIVGLTSPPIFNAVRPR